MVLATLVTRWLLIFWLFLVVVGAHTRRTLMWVTFIWTREAIVLSSTILHLILSCLLYKLELSTYATRFKALNYSCIAKRSFLRILIEPTNKDLEELMELLWNRGLQTYGTKGNRTRFCLISLRQRHKVDSLKTSQVKVSLNLVLGWK